MLGRCRLLLLLALSVAVPAAADVTPTPPPAGPPPSWRLPSGWTSGVRLGYALPMGDFAQLPDGRTAPLSGEFRGQIPFVLEAGYRFARYFTAGASFQLGSPILVTTGPGVAAAECHQTGVTSCSGNLALRLGLQLLFTFTPDSTFQPWLGVGAGFERAVYVLKDARGGTTSVDYAGWELFIVQLGLDVQATPGLAWGPYVALSVAQYSSVEGAKVLADSATLTLGNPKLHEWLQFGLRVRFGA